MVPKMRPSKCFAGKSGTGCMAVSPRGCSSSFKNSQTGYLAKSFGPIRSGKRTSFIPLQNIANAHLRASDVGRGMERLVHQLPPGVTAPHHHPPLLHGLPRASAADHEEGGRFIIIAPLPRAALRLPAIIFRPFRAFGLARCARKSTTEHLTPNIERGAKHFPTGSWMFVVGCFLLFGSRRTG